MRRGYQSPGDWVVYWHTHCEEQHCMWFSWLHYSGKWLPSLGPCNMPAEYSYHFTRRTLGFIVIWSLKVLRLCTCNGKAVILTSLGSPSKSRAKNFCEDKGRRCGEQASLYKDWPLAMLLSCQVLCLGLPWLGPVWEDLSATAHKYMMME